MHYGLCFMQSDRQLPRDRRQPLRLNPRVDVGVRVLVGLAVVYLVHVEEEVRQTSAMPYFS